MKDLDGGWFTVGACAGYVVLLFCDLPLVRYYPLNNIWTLRHLRPEDGPQMAWYGLFAGALLAGTVTMVLARMMRLSAVRGEAGVGVTLAALAGCMFFLRGFFA